MVFLLLLSSGVRKQTEESASWPSLSKLAYSGGSFPQVLLTAAVRWVLVAAERIFADVAFGPR